MASTVFFPISAVHRKWKYIKNGSIIGKFNYELDVVGISLPPLPLAAHCPSSKIDWFQFIFLFFFLFVLKFTFSHLIIMMADARFSRSVHQLCSATEFLVLPLKTIERINRKRILSANQPEKSRFNRSSTFSWIVNLRMKRAKGESIC